MMKTASCSHFRKEVEAYRLVFYSIIVLCILFYASIDDFISRMWNSLYDWKVFQHDSFEPVLSSVWFAVNFLFWVVVDFYCPSLHKYRITAGEGNNAWKGRESALYQEALWYVSPWLIIDYFFPRRKLPIAPPTFQSLVVEIFLALLMYDGLFFVGHWMMHRYKYLYETVHAKHHAIYSVRAADAIRHTFIDGSWDVACSVISLNVLQAHPLSRSLFNIVAITLITEAHCGMDFPWMLHNLVPFNLMAGSRAHYLHHQQGNVNFQKFFTYLDAICGTLRLDKEQALVHKY